jgi:hypothetical protein
MERAWFAAEGDECIVQYGHTPNCKAAQAKAQSFAPRQTQLRIAFS